VFDWGPGGDENSNMSSPADELMGVARCRTSSALRRLFEAFNRERDFLNLLDHSLKPKGCRSSSAMVGLPGGWTTGTVITAPYAAGNSVMGVLASSPDRMAYERVIPIRRMTAKLLGAALIPVDNPQASPSNLSGISG